MPLKLGVLPPRPDRPAIPFKALFKRENLPTPPPSWNATEGITKWGMLGNDQAGDCVVAGYLHLCMIAQKIATGVVPSFTAEQALALYSQLSGWNPDDPNSDTGLNVEDFLTLASQRTLIGQKLSTFAPVKFDTVEHLKTGIWLFNGINTAYTLPFDAEDQFGDHQPWSVDADQDNNPPLGGHDIPMVAYNDNSVTFVTWGTTQRATWDWAEKYLQTAELLIPVEIEGLTNAMANGYRPQQLQEFLNTV